MAIFLETEDQAFLSDINHLALEQPDGVVDSAVEMSRALLSYGHY
jgi:hypothetical protein